MSYWWAAPPALGCFTLSSKFSINYYFMLYVTNGFSSGDVGQLMKFPLCFDGRNQLFVMEKES